MRSPLLLFTLTVALSPSLSAQDYTKGAPLVLALGPAWNPQLTGLQFRGQYHLIPDRWLGLRLEVGGRWTPTQSFSAPSILYGDGSRYEGTAQSAAVDLALAATLTPWPRGSVSPYLVTGIAAVQSWGSGRGYYKAPDGSLAQVAPPASSTRGEVTGIWGYGLRVRLGGHPVELEFRRAAGWRSITLGTGLRF